MTHTQQRQTHIHNKHKCTCTKYTNNYTTNTYIHTHTTNTLAHTQQTQTPQHNIHKCSHNKHPLIDKTHIQQTETLTQQTHTQRTHTQNQKRLIQCIFHTYIYTLLVWVSVCPSVRLYPINVKTTEPIGPNFCGTSCDPREGLWICLHQIFF